MPENQWAVKAMVHSDFSISRYTVPDSKSESDKYLYTYCNNIPT